MYDPMERIRRLTNPFRGLPGQDDGPMFPEFSEEQGDSLIQQITNPLLGGLASAGHFLDKITGGRALRGLLGGKPRELLSVLPFSDTLGLTSEEDITSGKELLGLQNEEGILPFLAGMGTEILASPLSFGGGATNSLGRAAAKIGVLPKGAQGRLAGLAAGSKEAAALDAAIGANKIPLPSGWTGTAAGMPLGGHVGVGLPFLGNFLGTYDLSTPLDALGSLATKIPGVSTVWEGAKAAGRGLGSVLDPTVMGATTPKGREAGKYATALREADQAAARKSVAEDLIAMQKMGVNNPIDKSEFTETLEGFLPDTGKFGNVVAKNRAELDLMPIQAREKGLPLMDMTGPGEYGPRQALRYKKDAVSKARDMGTHDQFIRGRDDELAFVFGGKEGVKRAVQDPDMVNFDVATAKAKYINQWLDKSAAQAFAPEQIDQMAESFVYKVRSLPDDVRKAGLFGNDPLVDIAIRKHVHAETMANVNATHKLVFDTAVPMQPGQADMMSVGELFNKSGLYHKENDVSTALLSFAKAKNISLDEAKNFGVPAELAQEAMRFMSVYTMPNGIKPLVDKFDYLTTMTKAFQTAAWPAFHARNWISGVFQNWTKGAFDPHSYMQMDELLKTGVIKNLSETISDFRGLSAQEATERLMVEMYSQKVAGRGLMHNAADVLNTPESSVRSLEELIPGMIPKEGSAVKRYFHDVVPRSWEEADPRGIQGLGGRTLDTNAPIKAGRELGQRVEDINRGSMYIARRAQGWTPEAAALDTRLTHFDYSDLTGFERHVGKRVIPFYTFMRKNIPYTVEEALMNPTSRLGGSLRVAGAARDETGFTPEYLGQGLAMPLGAEEDGKRSFLTSLGLPFESAFENWAPGDTRRSAELAAGHLNPIIKTPIEMLAGKQFFSGRDIKDMGSTTGSGNLDVLLGNLPTGRFMSTGRMFADPNRDILSKGTQFLTGVRAQTANMDMARDMAAKDYINDLLQDNPAVRRLSRLYVPQDQLQNLSPQEVEMMRLARTLEMAAQRRSRMGA